MQHPQPTIIASKSKAWEASRLAIFLVCNIIKEKCGKKIMKCLESPIQPKGIRFDPFLKF